MFCTKRSKRNCYSFLSHELYLGRVQTKMLMQNTKEIHGKGEMQNYPDFAIFRSLFGQGHCDRHCVITMIFSYEVKTMMC